MDVQFVASGAPGQQPPAQPATPSAASSPEGDPPAADAAQPPSSGSLSPVVAKIFGHAPDRAPHPDAVNVSYRVEHDPNIIVTVFTDPNTGLEIAQVPAEVLVQIAQFFDKESGVTLDRSA